MLFYQLPKEKLIYGPNQIEAMINKNTTISQQLTLWDQRGSRVIRGRLIVTSIENSFLYIVPLYLQAEGTNFPQPKRVIAVAGDKVVMEATLDEALNALFGTQQPLEGSSQPLTPPPALEQARMQLEEARKAMQQGDWAKLERRWRVLSTSWPGRRRGKIRHDTLSIGGTPKRNGASNVARGPTNCQSTLGSPLRGPKFRIPLSSESRGCRREVGALSLAEGLGNVVFRES
jgi:hypothetical protein